MLKLNLESAFLFASSIKCDNWKSIDTTFHSVKYWYVLMQVLFNTNKLWKEISLFGTFAYYVMVQATAVSEADRTLYEGLVESTLVDMFD